MNVRLDRFCLAIALTVLGYGAVWAEGGRPSQETLQSMGLSGLTVMSDDEAMSVRGRGFMGRNGSSASAFGNSFATIDTPLGGAHSENGYTAEGKHFAKGANFSEAGVEITLPGRRPGMGHGDKRWPGHRGSAWRKPGMGGDHHGGGGHGGGGLGGGKTIRIRFFAGGHSFAKAH